MHEQPERLLMAFPHVIDWLETELPHLEADFDRNRQSPLEQADFLFHEFVTGEALQPFKRIRRLQPLDPNVWELKTPDLRFFGWFALRGVFVIAAADMATRCKREELYESYGEMVHRLRNELDLDEPKFIPGDYDNVL